MTVCNATAGDLSPAGQAGAAAWPGGEGERGGERAEWALAAGVQGETEQSEPWGPAEPNQASPPDLAAPSRPFSRIWVLFNPQLPHPLSSSAVAWDMGTFPGSSSASCSQNLTSLLAPSP